jgi:2-methylisocitrate lyase-like PEP mutase family enzyme
MTAKAFRNLLSQPEILVVPGTADAMSARIVEDVGLARCTQRAGIKRAVCPARYGLLTMTEMIEPIAALSKGHSVIADADPGLRKCRQ